MGSLPLASFVAALVTDSLESEDGHLIGLSSRRRAREARGSDAVVGREVLLALVHVGDDRGDGRVVRHAPDPELLARGRVVGVELRTRGEERRGTLLGRALVWQGRLDI